MGEEDVQERLEEQNLTKMDISIPVFSLGLPKNRWKYTVIPLYAIVIMSLLAIAELNPWGNDLNQPVGLEEENGYSSFIDVSWTELKSIHHGTIGLEEGVIWTIQDRWDCDRNSPEEAWIKATTDKGKEIDIFVPANTSPRLPPETSRCGEVVTQTDVYVEQNHNGSFELLSWAIYGSDPEDKANFEHVRWAFIGIVSAYLLLRFQPTELQNRLEKIRRKNTPYSKTTKDDWVIYDSWNLVENRKHEGDLISEHPSKLPQTESGVLTPWIFLVGIIFVLVHILLRELFILGGTSILVFLNHDLDFDIFALIIGGFVITVGPYVLIGKIINLRTNLANSVGIIAKKRRFMKMIEDVPTSTIRGMAVGRVEVAGVALRLPKSSKKGPTHKLIHRLDERVLGIQNPDNWPILRRFSGVKKEDIDPNQEISIMVHDGTGAVKVKMPRKNFVLGARRTKSYSNISTKRHWAIDEGDPVLVIGEAIIGKDGEIYIGADGVTKLPSAVFKGTEWTVQSGFRSTLEYILADILFVIVFVIFIMQFGGVL